MRAAWAKDWRTWVTISVERSPIFSRRRPRCTSACGREEMSTTTRLKASSRGQTASPKREMLFLWPRAWSSVSPRQIAQSSAVWWSSMCRSPLQTSVMSMRECLESCWIMWSRNPSPVVTSDFPEPSMFTEHAIVVSLVLRDTSATRRSPFSTRGRFADGADAAAAAAPSSCRGNISRRPASPGSRTRSAPEDKSTGSIFLDVVEIPRVLRAASSGVSTPTARTPLFTADTTSSGVSPTITASPGETPSLLSASCTGKGSGLAGPSSMHTQARKRCSRSWVRRKASQSLIGRPVTTAMPAGQRAWSSSRSALLGMSVSRLHRPGRPSAPWYKSSNLSFTSS
mmetsp:Transcript_24271/g.71276  ORF Transcript_24271/g.71276 Transcript_24271/m.71276 type:complete len:341 (-) Transcript_24271:248-1270(-)